LIVSAVKIDEQYLQADPRPPTWASPLDATGSLPYPRFPCL